MELRSRAAIVGLLGLAYTTACSGRDNPSHIPGSGSAGSGVSAVSGGSGSGSATTGGGAGGGTGAGGASGEGPAPEPADLPVPYGTCPVFSSGYNTLKIPGIPERGLEIRFSSATESDDGPLVIVWHGDDQSPKAALEELLGSKYVAKVLAAGGVVAVPDSDPLTKGNVWYSAGGDFTVDDDFVVQDQIVACARQQFGIDTRHIHVVGYQHGGFQAAHSAMVRSSYVASAIVHSGGVSAMAKEQKVKLAYPFMILHGGETLDVAAESYGAASVALAKLAAEGGAPFSAEHYTLLCDHGTGSTIATDALPATYQFMLDHPFGTKDSPYSQGLPPEVPSYCATAH